MRILIISEYIAPLQAVASIRWTKIAKYIKKSYPDSYITVFTNQKNFENETEGLLQQKKDPMLEKDMEVFDKYLEFPSGRIAGIYEKMKAAKRGRLRHYVQLNKYTQVDDIKANIKKALFMAALDLRDYGIYLRAKSALKSTSENYDIIISSHGPSWTHRLAAHIKKKCLQVRWIADYRDPYARDWEDPISYQRHKHFSQNICAKADVILRVTDGLETHTLNSIPVITVSNGFDPAERLPPKAPKKFSIVFTGLLYGEMSDIGIACRVLRELCDENRIAREDVEVSYAGPDGKLAMELAQRYAAGEFIKDYGVCSRKVALSMQQNAAILLQLHWNTDNEKCSWSGKMYEYMMSGKPIVCIITGNVPNSIPSREIYHLGGCCYEQCRHEETYPQIKAYILEKYQEWKTTGNVNVKQDKEYIEQYSYARISHRVWELIDCDSI